MRVYFTILFLWLGQVWLGQTVWSQDAASMASIRQIDSLEDWAGAQVQGKMVKMGDSVGAVLDLALRGSRQSGYLHGVAMGLAFKASLVMGQTNDFVQAERVARQSLDSYALCVNKKGIETAYYVLGFSLFGQSRFDEAIHSYEKAREIAHQTGDSVNEVELLLMIGQAYRDRGDYAKAFDIQQQCIRLAEARHDESFLSYQYFTLADLFTCVEDYHSAKKYFGIGFQHGVPLSKLDHWDNLIYCEVLTRLHQYDSAEYLYDRSDSAHLTPAMLRFFLVSKGEYYQYRGDQATALPYFIKSLSYHLQLNDRNQVMRCLGDLARAELGLGQDTAALRYAREDLRLAEVYNARQNIRDACQLLYLLYDREHRTDSAYTYLRRYYVQKDSVLNDQVKGRFASYGFEQQLRIVSQEKRLAEECLRTEMLTKNLLILGISVLVLLSAIYLWIIRLRRKNEEQRLLKRAKELEVQALRSQMNPHFMFNCLNAVNRFILTHETEAASDYLTKFSRLMRMIMNHSRYATVSLAEELEMLRLYLEMERLRFKDAFDYRINLDEGVDAEEIHIPPLLLQPFVENAVWHGLMHKDGRGQLTITICLTGPVLTCVIRDDGVGRRQAALMKSKSVEKHKSMGLQITAERMALLTGTDVEEPFFTIRDLYEEESAAGTEVTLKISIYDKSDDHR